MINTHEMARDPAHPDARTLLFGSMARLAYDGHDAEDHVRATYQQMVRISIEPKWALL